MSINCENQSQHINAVDYVTGQPTTAERQAVEAHLVGCVDCQAAVKAVQQLKTDQIGQNTQTLVSFVADLLVSTVILIVPVANQLAKPPQPQEPDDEPAELSFFEPLRVLQPRVKAGAQSMRRFIGRFSLVLF